MDNDFEGDGGDGKIEDKIDGNACAKSTANPRVISASNSSDSGSSGLDVSCGEPDVIHTWRTT